MTNEEFKKYLHDINISQSELAKMLGVDASTVSKWISGENPIPRTVDLIAFGVPRKLRRKECSTN